MVNLLDIMREAQGGRALDHLGLEFGLDRSKVEGALGAILPAFSLGLKNTLYDPTAFGHLVDLVASGRYLPFFDGGNVPGAGQAGGDALVRVFGSSAVTQRIAEQGSAMAGIGVDVMQRMMPMVAATLIGGLFKHASLEGIGDLLAQWSEAFHRAHAVTRPPPPRQVVAPPAAFAVANPFEWWSGLLSSGQAKPATSPVTPTLPRKTDDTMASTIDAWSQMVTAMLGAPPTRSTGLADPRQPQASNASVAGPNPFQIFMRMFDAGREIQAQQLGQLMTVLDGRPVEQSRRP